MLESTTARACATVRSAESASPAWDWAVASDTRAAPRCSAKPGCARATVTASV